MIDNPNASRAFATLRMIGKDLDPDEVTERLGLNPTNSHKQGDVRGHGTWPQGYWEITSQARVVSTDLALHIEWLLDQIEPVREEFISLISSGIRADMFCFWESQTGNGGPSFKPKLMARLANLDLELGLDIYFAS